MSFLFLFLLFFFFGLFLEMERERACVHGADWNRDLIFSVAQVVSFLSQGTTLPKGTVIITGTPAGVGFAHKPQELLHDGDEFVVEIQPHIGSLYNVMQNEK